MSVESVPRPPFHADHVGSLLRPANLRQAHREFSAGRIDGEQFTKIQNQAIIEVVALQERAGLQSITDGEFRRASYWAHFVDKVEGFTVKPAVFTFHGDEGDEQQFLAPYVEGRLRRSQEISGREFDFLNSVTAGTPKITMPSPPTMHFWRGRQGVETMAYPEIEEFFDDLAGVFRDEIDDLAARGARYLQIDEVPLAMLCDPRVRQRLEAMGEPPDRLLGRYIDLINASVSTRPKDMVMAMHLCRGNFKGRWLSEGGYEHVAERLFNDIDVDSFFLEFDSPRAGDFAPLRFVPEGKSVVLGLVSSKTPMLESKDDLKRRIDEAGRFMPIGRLALSPQCGFASTVAGNPLTMSEEERKLSLIVEVADEVWG